MSLQGPKMSLGGGWLDLSVPLPNVITLNKFPFLLSTVNLALLIGFLKMVTKPGLSYSCDPQVWKQQVLQTSNQSTFWLNLVRFHPNPCPALAHMPIWLTFFGFKCFNCFGIDMVYQPPPPLQGSKYILLVRFHQFWICACCHGKKEIKLDTVVL